MEGYQIDRTLLTSSEMRSILAGLKSLDSVCGTSQYKQLMDKLSIENTASLASDSHIQIDLSSWYKTSLIPKIELIQAAIENTQIISFLYYSAKGVSRRIYRLFKLNRLQSLSGTHEKFVKRDHPDVDLSTQRIFPSCRSI